MITISSLVVSPARSSQSSHRPRAPAARGALPAHSNGGNNSESRPVRGVDADVGPHAITLPARKGNPSRPWTARGETNYFALPLKDVLPWVELASHPEVDRDADRAEAKRLRTWDRKEVQPVCRNGDCRDDSAPGQDD